MVAIDARGRAGVRQMQNIPGVRVPNIRMRPKDMLVIGNVLSLCDQHTQGIFIFMMEHWDRAGQVVGTTARSIVLDAPCGRATSRIAMLFQGDLANPASAPPMILLMWNVLRKRKEFPAAAVAEYQSAVKRSVRMRETESSAHIRLDGTFGTPHARRVLQAMLKLARSIRPDLAETPPPSKPVTPDNVRGTMAQCPPAAQAIFKNLIARWQAAGGTVQAKSVGRIYLKLKTRAHSSGRCARLPRNFNLLVLAAPKGKQPAHIQAGWNLARSEYTAYLDCIPRLVGNYERTVAALPGFVRKGTLSRILLDEKFTRRHVEALAKCIVGLRAAEEAAP